MGDVVVMSSGHSSLWTVDIYPMDRTEGGSATGSHTLVGHESDCGGGTKEPRTALYERQQHAEQALCTKYCLLCADEGPGLRGKIAPLSHKRELLHSSAALQCRIL